MTRDLKYTNLVNQFYGENQRHTSYLARDLEELMSIYVQPVTKAYKLSVDDWHIDLIYKPMLYHIKGLRQTASGYGKALTSPYMVEFEGRKYRIYTTLYSNSDSGDRWLEYSWFKTKKYGTIIVN